MFPTWLHTRQSSPVQSSPVGPLTSPWPAPPGHHQQAINLNLPACRPTRSHASHHHGLTRTNWPMSRNLLLFIQLLRLAALSVEPIQSDLCQQSSQFFWHFFRSQSLRLWDPTTPTCLTLLRAETKDKQNEQNDVKSERQYLYLADCWMVPLTAHRNHQSLGWIHYETQTSR